MDSNNWRPTPPSGEPTMDTGDWRTQLQPDSRQRIVNKIMDTLKRHFPFSGQEGLNELRKIAVRFEEKIFMAASSQSDYQQKISMKMLTMETKSQNTIPNPGNNSRPPDPASLDSTARTGANGGDWQEEVYQKIKAMKETYLPDLNEMHQKIAAKLLQHDSLPQQSKSEQLEKLKIFKTILERTMNFLSISKSAILPTLKDKLSSYEKQIINFVNINRRGKPILVLQQGQLPPTNMPPMEQPQPQIYQTQSHDNQMNPLLQSINLQSSMPTMQPNNMKSLQHNSFSSLPGVSTAQQAVLNSLQPGSNLDPGQGNALGSMQLVAPGPLQQNPVSTAQQANISSLSLQSGLSVLQQNMNPLLLNSNMLHYQHMKQQQEQQILQLQQRLIQLQYMQRHKLLQQQQQQQSQLQAHQMTQLHQMNENDMRQGISVKAGVFQQHLPEGQSQSYNHQQLKLGAPFPISSPQLLQAASPQMPQHSSPQFDQQSLLTSISKTGIPLQCANSPFVVPFPSTPLAPSPMPVEFGKPVPGTSALSNAANIGCRQVTDVQAGSQSLAIGTPGISASPLLAEFTVADGTHANNALTTDYGKPNITEQPDDPRSNVAKPIPHKSLSATVVTMVDEAAAAVGEDLAAMRKRGLHARNFFTQTGMSGAEKMRCCVSALVILALMIWFIFIHKSPILKH